VRYHPQGGTAGPNRVRDLTPDLSNNSSQGTLDLRHYGNVLGHLPSSSAFPFPNDFPRTLAFDALESRRSSPETFRCKEIVIVHLRR